VIGRIVSIGVFPMLSCVFGARALRATMIAMTCLLPTDALAQQEQDFQMWHELELGEASVVAAFYGAITQQKPVTMKQERALLVQQPLAKHFARLGLWPEAPFVLPWLASRRDWFLPLAAAERGRYTILVSTPFEFHSLDGNEAAWVNIKFIRACYAESLNGSRYARYKEVVFPLRVDDGRILAPDIMIGGFDGASIGKLVGGPSDREDIGDHGPATRALPVGAVGRELAPETKAVLQLYELLGEAPGAAAGDPVPFPLDLGDFLAKDILAAAPPGEAPSAAVTGWMRARHQWFAPETNADVAGKRIRVSSPFTFFAIDYRNGKYEVRDIKHTKYVTVLFNIEPRSDMRVRWREIVIPVDVKTGRIHLGRVELGGFDGITLYEVMKVDPVELSARGR
jgi:hypothetical protein